jgi:hypothetical protein
MRQRFPTGEQSDALAGAQKLHLLLHDDHAVDIA